MSRSSQARNRSSAWSRANVLISEFRDNEIRLLIGWTGHRFERPDAEWKIGAKQVNLLECDQCLRNPSIIL